MMAPGLIVLFVFAYLPMFGIIIAFKDSRLPGRPGQPAGRLQELLLLFRPTTRADRTSNDPLHERALHRQASWWWRLGIALLLKGVQGSNRWVRGSTIDPVLPLSLFVRDHQLLVFALLNTSNGLIQPTRL